MGLSGGMAGGWEWGRHRSGSTTHRTEIALRLTPSSLSPFLSLRFLLLDFLFFFLVFLSLPWEVHPPWRKSRVEACVRRQTRQGYMKGVRLAALPETPTATVTATVGEGRGRTLNAPGPSSFCSLLCSISSSSSFCPRCCCCRCYRHYPSCCCCHCRCRSCPSRHC